MLQSSCLHLLDLFLLVQLLLLLHDPMYVDVETATVEVVADDDAAKRDGQELLGSRLPIRRKRLGFWLPRTKPEQRSLGTATASGLF